MTPPLRPLAWIAARGPPAAVACALGGAALVAVAATVWDATIALGTLPALLLAAAGLGMASAGAACLVRPSGRLGPPSQRLLDDAARHHASGSLSPEGFQATRDRLHAQAHARSVPQAALALSLFGAALFLLAFPLAGSVLSLLGSSASGSGTALGMAGASAVATLGAAVVVLAQASRWRARARAEASALQQMLADLESDILDEVRRSTAVAAAGHEAGP